MKRIIALITVLALYAMFVAGFSFASSRSFNVNTVNNLEIEETYQANGDAYRLGYDPCPDPPFPPPPPVDRVGYDPCPDPPFPPPPPISG